MLNRDKLAKSIESVVSKLFPDLSDSSEIAKKIWQEISSDNAFPHKVLASHSSFLIPSWNGNLADGFDVFDKAEEYTVIAVDGSQIYPDRHVSGVGCFLINAGGCVLRYAKESSVSFFSEPKVLFPEDITGDNFKISFSRDLVDLKREEYEFKFSLQQALDCLDNGEEPVCFFDGSIIFWPLEGKTPEVKKIFLNCYLYYLEQFYKNKILIAGYISMPKSRELVNLIRLGLCRFTVADCIACHSQYKDFPCNQVDCLLDTYVAKLFLKKKQRTTIFYSSSKIVELYPEHLKPSFFYYDVGAEIVRIEIPFWISQDKKFLDRICAVAFDQAEKGRGYPVCLAEAHEQAVVKGADRDFFYHLLYKIGLEQKRTFHLSQKAIKKRGIGI